MSIEAGIVSAYTYNNHVLSLVKSESNYYYDSFLAVGIRKDEEKKRVYEELNKPLALDDSGRNDYSPKLG